MRAASLGFAVAMLTACQCSGTSGDHVGPTAPAPAQASAPVPRDAVVVTAFGAKGDGVTDDRAAIQAALDAAASRTGEVYFPPGTYAVSGAPGRAFGLEVRGELHLRGAGAARTVLLQAPGAGPSVRLINVSGDGVVIEDLTLDGNRSAQSVNEQRHGLFVTAADGLRVHRVTARNFTGDGFYLYTGARHARFVGAVATGNARNGITLGGMVDDTVIVGSRFVGNAVQQVDSEPGAPNVVTNTVIMFSLLDAGGVSTQYVLTCSGTTLALKGRGWTVINNTLNGGVFVVAADDVLIAYNTGVNATPRPFITVERAAVGVVILGNKLVQAQRTASLSGVFIVGTRGSSPARVRVEGNDIENLDERSFGVRVMGAVSVEIVDNVLHGAGRAARGYAGIHLRATKIEDGFRSAVVRGNTIRNFGDRGINIVGNGAARLESLDIRDNTFIDDSPQPAMTVGISLDDGTGVVEHAEVRNNKFLGGVRTPMINPPRGGLGTAPP